MNTFERIVSVLSMAVVCVSCVGGTSSPQPATQSPPPDPGQPGVFADETSERLPAVSNVAVRAAGGDIDNDGDIDIIVTTGPHTGARAAPPEDMVLHINNGQGVFASEAGSRLPATALGPQNANAAVFGDVDGDADLDGMRPGATIV